MALPLEVRNTYIGIIDDILSKADLNTIGEKRILRGIREQVEYDITPQKAAISELILQRFDIFDARQNGDTSPIPSVETTQPSNGYIEQPSRDASPVKRPVDSDDSSDVIDDQPAKKKRKPSIDEDAAFAARLQAEEDKRARPTRNGASRKTATTKKKRTPKKKTSTRITGSDDSEIEDDAPARKVNRDTGFHKPLNLSPALSALFDGETSLSRPQVTKRIWQYIKGHDLQDPGDKRFIICDDQLRNVFKQDKVHMFTMTKLLNQQMYAADE